MSPDLRRGFWLVGGAIVLDRLLKALAISGQSSAGDFVRFTLFKNDGIAFSLPFSGPMVWILSLLIIGGALYVLMSDVRKHRWDRLVPLSFFVLGAVSNLFDRIVYGFTIDYLIFFNRSAVNLADGMIVVGAVWLILMRPQPHATNPSPNEPYARS